MLQLLNDLLPTSEKITFTNRRVLVFRFVHRQVRRMWVTVYRTESLLRK